MAPEKVGARHIGWIGVVLAVLILLGILFYLAWTEMHPRQQSKLSQNTPVQFANLAALGNLARSSVRRKLRKDVKKEEQRNEDCTRNEDDFVLGSHASDYCADPR